MGLTRLLGDRPNMQEGTLDHLTNIETYIKVATCQTKQLGPSSDDLLIIENAN